MFISLLFSILTIGDFSTLGIIFEIPIIIRPRKFGVLLLEDSLDKIFELKLKLKLSKSRNSSISWIADCVFFLKDSLLIIRN